jgi:hypothetical protein
VIRCQFSGHSLSPYIFEALFQIVLDPTWSLHSDMVLVFNPDLWQHNSCKHNSCQHSSLNNLFDNIILVILILVNINLWTTTDNIRKQWMLNQIIHKQWFTTLVIPMAIIMSTILSCHNNWGHKGRVSYRERRKSKASKTSTVASSWWLTQFHKINWHLSGEFEQSNRFWSRERRAHS